MSYFLTKRVARVGNLGKDVIPTKMAYWPMIRGTKWLTVEDQTKRPYPTCQGKWDTFWVKRNPSFTHQPENEQHIMPRSIRFVMFGINVVLSTKQTRTKTRLRVRWQTKQSDHAIEQTPPSRSTHHRYYLIKNWTPKSTFLRLRPVTTSLSKKNRCIFQNRKGHRRSDKSQSDLNKNPPAPSDLSGFSVFAFLVFAFPSSGFWFSVCGFWNFHYANTPPSLSAIGKRALLKTPSHFSGSPSRRFDFLIS